MNNAFKQTMEGDFNRSSTDDVNKLLAFGGNGRMYR